jgi:hypothetical protein
MRSSPMEVPIACQVAPSFTRRPDPVGGTASFCNHCYRTVAVSESEAELDGAEECHTCDMSLLDYWKSLADSQARLKQG